MIRLARGLIGISGWLIIAIHLEHTVTTIMAAAACIFILGDLLTPVKGNDRL